MDQNNEIEFLFRNRKKLPEKLEPFTFYDRHTKIRVAPNFKLNFIGLLYNFDETDMEFTYFHLN